LAVKAFVSGNVDHIISVQVILTQLVDIAIAQICAVSLLPCCRQSVNVHACVNC